MKNNIEKIALSEENDKEIIDDWCYARYYRCN